MISSIVAVELFCSYMARISSPTDYIFIRTTSGVVGIDGRHMHIPHYMLAIVSIGIGVLF